MIERRANHKGKTKLSQSKYGSSDTTTKSRKPAAKFQKKVVVVDHMYMQGFHQSIKFTYAISTTEAEATFLDVTVYEGRRREETRILDGKTHFKPTNTFQYVHAGSCHPA